MPTSRLAVLLSAAVLPLSGCGGSGSPGSGGPDPAKVVPASAPAYLEAVVRPEGDVRDGAHDALVKLLRTDDPEARIVGLFDDAAGKGDVTWDELKAWLGPRVGVFLSDVADGAPVAALVADQTDEGKAKATLDKLAADAEPGKVATAIIDDYAVIGTPAGVAAVEATQKAGKGLDQAGDFQAAREAVAAGDGIVTGYVAPQALLDLVAELGGSRAEGSPFADGRALGLLRQVAARAGRAAALSLHATGDALRVDTAAIGAPDGAGTGTAADSLAALPGDAWVGIGFGDLGRALTDALAQVAQIGRLGAAGGQGFDADALLRGFERRTGIDVQRDFLSWMGEGAIYARGRSIADIGGAITIATKDPERSRKAVGILARGLARTGMTARPARVEGYDVAIELRSASAPISLFVAANDDRFSLGVNPRALSDIADPSSRLEDADAYGRATDALGGDVRPVAIVDTPTIVGLVESFGVGQVDSYARVKPYLDALGPITAGSARDGDIARGSFAVALR